MPPKSKGKPSANAGKKTTTVNDVALQSSPPPRDPQLFQSQHLIDLVNKLLCSTVLQEESQHLNTPTEADRTAAAIASVLSDSVKEKLIRSANHASSTDLIPLISKIIQACSHPDSSLDAFAISRTQMLCLTEALEEIIETRNRPSASHSLVQQASEIRKRKGTGQHASSGAATDVHSGGKQASNANGKSLLRSRLCLLLLLSAAAAGYFYMISSANGSEERGKKAPKPVVDSFIAQHLRQIIQFNKLREADVNFQAILMQSREKRRAESSVIRSSHFDRIDRFESNLLQPMHASLPADAGARLIQKAAQNAKKYAARVTHGSSIGSSPSSSYGAVVRVAVLTKPLRTAVDQAIFDHYHLMLAYFVAALETNGDDDLNRQKVVRLIDVDERVAKLHPQLDAVFEEARESPECNYIVVLSLPHISAVDRSTMQSLKSLIEFGESSGKRVIACPNSLVIFIRADDTNDLKASFSSDHDLDRVRHLFVKDFSFTEALGE